MKGRLIMSEIEILLSIIKQDFGHRPSGDSEEQTSEFENRGVISGIARITE